jgi:16S rRNA (adenine(1408)-N(1))-methyltransferase
LEKISERIHRKPAKGGAPNILFVKAAAEALPSELDNIATEVHVNLPWGSLLRGVVMGDTPVAGNLRRICRSNALLKVLIGLDLERDRSEITRLALPEFDAGYIDSVLVKVYRKAGFDLIQMENIAASDQSEFQTSWAGRLRLSSHRVFIRITARATDVQSGA